MRPEHRLLGREGAVTLHEYWDAPFISEKTTSISHALSTLEELVRRSIAERLTGVEKPALLFSGGVDSLFSFLGC